MVDEVQLSYEGLLSPLLLFVSGLRLLDLVDCLEVLLKALEIGEESH